MQTVLITGVSRGIGKALAERFLESGDFVIGTSTTGKTSLTHSNLVVFPLELSESKNIDLCVQAIVELGKKIDILINNAAALMATDTGPNIHVDTLRKTLEINLIGQIAFTQGLLPLVTKGGHIVNVSSRQGSLTYIDSTADVGVLDPSYRISKAALNMFTRVLALSLKDNITVSSVYPGSVQTDMGFANASMTPKEAAEHIFYLANSRPATGQFWFKGEKFPW